MWRNISPPSTLFELLIGLWLFPLLNSAELPHEAAWRMTNYTWVAYAPTEWNPLKGIRPSSTSIEADLTAVRRASFDGLVTYGCDGIMGAEFVGLAEAAGFKAIIIGIWNPKSAMEFKAATNAAISSTVVGFCVGNEGLDERYSFLDLEQSIERLRRATRKPVTTTEQIEDYHDGRLARIGDWSFPTVHAYFHSKTVPADAVSWTLKEYVSLKKRTDRLVLFKEVGLPTDGDPDAGVSEENQLAYYMQLAQSPVPFVYFEAFDQTWKRHLPVEPHWGLFRSDRTPKKTAEGLIKNRLR
jgi:exo-beta-1,3-glucanase (GH17 family)